ncbi:MAG: hypothetical protein EZS28_016500 [Streblomastix strix]|uniref:Uncharacterized protein n=1 Tax=Streblomastix strix TaxID=222440 RepID=A0A5J4VZ74_9EUKA|nr:MAG: hypothetical protein EZS28_016500 [Streblomastix strix]
MLAWKMATDDSLQGKLTPGIVDFSLIDGGEKQDHLPAFYATRAYPTPGKASIIPQMFYLYDAIIRFIFDDASAPQVLNFEIIGEIGETMVRSG